MVTTSLGIVRNLGLGFGDKLPRSVFVVKPRNAFDQPPLGADKLVEIDVFIAGVVPGIVIFHSLDLQLPELLWVHGV